MSEAAHGHDADWRSCPFGRGGCHFSSAPFPPHWPALSNRRMIPSKPHSGLRTSLKMVVDTGANRPSWFVIPLLEPLDWMLMKDSSSRAHDDQDRSQQHHFTQMILLTSDPPHQECGTCDTRGSSCLPRSTSEHDPGRFATDTALSRLSADLHDLDEVGPMLRIYHKSRINVGEA